MRFYHHSNRMFVHRVPQEDAVRMESVASQLPSPRVASPRVTSPTKTDPKLLSRLSTLDMMTINQNKSLSVRDRIREMHALKLAPFPVACRRESTVTDVTPMSLASLPCCAHPYHSADTTLHLDLHGLSWKRRYIPTNDLLGAAVSAALPSLFVVHYLEKMVLDTTVATSAETWASAQSYLAMASIACTVVASEDIVSFGQSLPVGGAFEACLVVGTALSLHRLVNGIFQQQELRWRTLLPSLPLGLLLSSPLSPSAPLIPAANAVLIYNLIKRKIRPRHAVACHFNQEFVVLATDSVTLGQTSFGATSQGSIMPSVQFQASSSVTPVDPNTPPTDSDDDPNVNLQHHAELCSAYKDIDPTLKMWKGSITGNQDVQHEATSRTPPLLGLRLRLLHRHQVMAVQQFTPGSLWHRWAQHRPFSSSSSPLKNILSPQDGASQASSLVLALPHVWNVSIDTSPTRLVSGHVQFDVLPHLLHCLM
ncbi:hypothetical protein DYB30_002598 [Aphanomyces astaci]|uniref:Uncharacterized protein n=1 Tax=Aphanomyces astaci TaxID=112090 RepID=A0A397DCB4_APHAT|nr:hypothetical protein DYB30_002598 [Aphanomyces astaci]